MFRAKITGLAIVSVVAGLKTYLLVHFALTKASITLGTVSGIYAMFFFLTAVVAYASFAILRSHMEQQRKDKLAPGASEPVAKETIILRNAADWGLSKAEADVAIFVAKGFSNAEIADMRGCAIATVKSQLGRIYNKTGLGSRYQLISYVTDEVCAMATEHEPNGPQVETRKVLPLVGPSASAA